MKTDGILTIAVLLLVLWLAISKVNGESRLSLLLKAIGVGGKPDEKFVPPAGVTRAPNMANPSLYGGIPPDVANDLGGFGVVLSREPNSLPNFASVPTYPGPASNPFSADPNDTIGAYFLRSQYGVN